MKSFKKVFFVPLLIMIIAGLGLYIFFDKKDAVIETGALPISKQTSDQSVSTNYPSTQNSKVVENTTTSAANPPSSVNTLTEAEILGATYRIAPNFAGITSSAHNIVFPAAPAGSQDLSGKVFITRDGKVSKDPANPTGELFLIKNYKYTDSSRTEAKVFIVGNFGTSAFDDRMFIVSKVNGMVVTKEVPCNKNQQGACPMDLN